MNLSIVGTGYVGLTCAAGFAAMGNRVVCMDIDAGRIDRLQRGLVDIYEPGLDDLVARGAADGSLKFTSSLAEALAGCELCFIAVGTPTAEGGEADLSAVKAVAEEIGKILRSRAKGPAAITGPSSASGEDATLQADVGIVLKSTVPVGTADMVRAIINEAASEAGFSARVISNPEFLKEGAAVEDFMKPDRIVLGLADQKSLEQMRELYAPFSRHHDKIMVMDNRSAEMTKYAANAMLATRISFINEIACICEKVGADVNQVRRGIGADPRIGYSFLYPGCGYGGSCFPKDVKALIHTAERHEVRPALLAAVEAVNIRQKKIMADKVVKRFGPDLAGRTFAAWGLSFKPGTDDLREAPSLDIIAELLARGGRVKAYDPKAMQKAEEGPLGGRVIYCDGKYDAVKEADALILITEWNEFRSPDFLEIKARLKSPVIFDGRNQYERRELEALGFEYYSIGT
ncbi:UDP-glucose/GDP-mannose dehydrogenase family protein [Deltaproteobacteria bacterium OttesenSCG-928-K17]|nr:UDP-glucose/GDP-mannose dehydrogenase family protein [Deltaproteobacteria bacterium OttesenSCG-928-K17]